jgi:cation diffusion facilitator family transporter
LKGGWSAMTARSLRRFLQVVIDADQQKLASGFRQTAQTKTIDRHALFRYTRSMSDRHSHHDSRTHSHKHSHEKKTRIVVYLTAVTMIVEIAFGYYTNSMALLADGWHMSSHALALGLSWIAYALSRKHHNNPNFRQGTDKILSLSGYTSALSLLAIAIWMAIVSVERFFNPVPIKFHEAIFVAVVGLLVNGLSAVVLHHKEEHSDHNIRSAYLHVLADGLTSVTAIIALTAGMYWKLYALDPISGIISSVIITRWAIGLAINSGKDLLDYRAN